MKSTYILASSTQAKLLCCVLVIILAFLFACCAKKESSPLVSKGSLARYIDTTVMVYGPYAAVKLPITKGVKISNPIQIELGPRKTLYAANQTGEVYTLRDTDNDGLEDTAALYCNVRDFGLRSPAGFAFRGDTIYVGTSQQIRAFLDLDNDAKADTSWTFFDDIPQSEHPYEWTTGFAFGPDGWLYFNLTTDSWNAAPSPDPGLYRGAVLRISPNGKKIERVASGIRSVPSMAFNEHGDLFFTDNEGGGNPTEELNRLVVNGFYGHNPTKYKPGPTTVPEHVLEMEVAPSGLTFNKGDNDFGEAAGNLFVTYYGPGERWTRGAVSRLQLERSADGSYKYQEFAVADIPKLSDLAFGADGNLYLAQHGKADYWYNVVYENQGNFYKLIYDPTIPPSKKIAKARDVSFSENSIETGKQLFAEQACLGCHQVDGVTELLGPNLKDVSKRLSREEILEEILKPSERIKPSMIAQRITKKDGQILIGRVVNSDANRISLMLVGNQVVDIMRKDILRTENEMKSLMYEGLLNGLQEDQKEALLNFIVSLSN